MQIFVGLFLAHVIKDIAAHLQTEISNLHEIIFIGLPIFML
jgi:hypothetical protein